jgi:prevent-host-death family protein
MIVANVKDLKARLNRYLRLVESGKTVVITRRGRVVGQVGPAGRFAKTSLEGVMLSLAEQGLVELPTRSGPVGLHPRARVRDVAAARRILNADIGRRKQR